MSLPVVLRDEARAEFDEAFDFYDAERAGLGTEFVEQIQAVFDRIASQPRMHAVVLGDVRRAVAGKKFPYVVYYRAESARIEVSSVFHQGRFLIDRQSRIVSSGLRPDQEMTTRGASRLP